MIKTGSSCLSGLELTPQIAKVLDTLPNTYPSRLRCSKLLNAMRMVIHTYGLNCLKSTQNILLGRIYP